MTICTLVGYLDRLSSLASLVIYVFLWTLLALALQVGAYVRVLLTRLSRLGARVGRANLMEQVSCCSATYRRNLPALLVLLAWTRTPPDFCSSWVSRVGGSRVSVVPAMATRLVVAPELVPLGWRRTVSGLLAFLSLRLRNVYRGRQLKLCPNAGVVRLPLSRMPTRAVLRLTISGSPVSVFVVGERLLVKV